MQKAPHVVPIIGSRKIESLNVQLSSNDIRDIEEAYEFDRGFPHNFLSGTMFDHSRPRSATSPQDV